MSTLSDIFGPPIHTYTRAEAIADGVLIEATASVLGRFPHSRGVHRRRPRRHHRVRRRNRRTAS